MCSTALDWQALSENVLEDIVFSQIPKSGNFYTKALTNLFQTNIYRCNLIHLQGRVMVVHASAQHLTIGVVDQWFPPDYALLFACSLTEKRPRFALQKPTTPGYFGALSIELDTS